jgi:tetratricopeptide (TPR) repeat protein
MDYRIEQLRYLLREDPSSRVFFQLGELLRRDGEAAEAAEILTTGLDRHPRYVAAWVALGRAHRDLGALDEAVSAFETALGIDRENPVAARLLGETAMEREDWLGAVKALKLTRALAGGDEELDAKIALVEERLGERGHLPPVPATRPTIRPVERCLEVVSLSADDPFAPAADEDEDLGPASDVFEIVEAAPEAVTEAETEAEAETETEAEAEAETEAETEAGAEAETEAETEAEAEAEAEPEAEPVPVVGAAFVDESSVGAWSEMRAAGVTGDEAWSEPTDELPEGGADDVAAEAWTDPAAAAPLDESAEADDADEDSAADEGDVEEFRPEPADDEPPLDAPMEREPEPQDAEDTAPEPVQTFEPIEVTHPDVEHERAAAAEAEAAARAEEEARLQAEAEEAARAEAEAAAKAEEEAAAEAEEAAHAPSDEDDVAADRRHELSHGVPLPTMTLANLALEQGDRPLAMATLESLIERDPSHATAIDLLDRLRGEERAVADEKLRAVRATAKIAALQGWLDAVRLAAERRVQ